MVLQIKLNEKDIGNATISDVYELYACINDLEGETFKNQSERDVSDFMPMFMTSEFGIYASGTWACRLLGIDKLYTQSRQMLWLVHFQVL